MRKLLTAIFLSAMLTGAAAYADEKPSPLTEKQAIERLHENKEVYSCTMKANWFSDKPGKCPCCTMDLEKVKEIKDGKAVFEESKDSSKGKM